MRAASAADYQRHIESLRAKLPGFSFVVVPPFVVAGNEDAATVKEHARTVVEWTIQRLKKDFFPQDPDPILDILLFKDASSYRHYCVQLFGRPPDTPYGFYLESQHALVMNIATGGGTLVHEMVHPYTRVNFPACPPWFFEGLGSLFEQSDDRDGHIVGLTNWRLAGLQEAIGNGAVLPFEKLFALDTAAFYGDGSGVHYAQSRYFCYYLQEKGLLVPFYRAFHDGVKSDPSGLKTARRILGVHNMVAFQKQWEKFVLNLRFP